MQRNGKILFVVIAVVAIWLVKFVLRFPSVDINVIGVILSISSILFGLLAGFFISQLWTRYTEIRTLQGQRSSAGLLLIEYANHFYARNPQFKKDFRKRMEHAAIVDEIIYWDEGYLEDPYYRAIASSFRMVKVQNEKDGVYLEAMMENLDRYVSSTVQINILYKERLFVSEWLIFIILSAIITLSVLLLDVSQILYFMIVLAFPPIIFLTLSIISDLNTMSWGRELITLEPTQAIFDALGVKRFYLTKDLPFVSRRIRQYRTEKTLAPAERKVYKEILDSRMYQQRA